MPMRAGNAARPAPAARESFRRGAVLASAALAALACSSCAPVGRGILVPNLRPTVELTAAPAVRDSTAPYFYAYRMDWSGNDTDGRIDHFEYCIDPTSADSVWIRTTKNEQIVFFRASHPDPVRDREQPTASDPHVFVIKAVDDRGGESARRNRAFFAFTI